VNAGQAAAVTRPPCDPDTGRWGHCTQTIGYEDGRIVSVHEDCPLHGEPRRNGGER
jgi:hypothetical protein